MIPIPSDRGRSVGASARRECSPAYASTTPPAPPASDSRTLSVANCQTSRHRPAPSAVRMAISLPSFAPLATRRLAIFEQATSNTQRAAPPRTQRPRRTGRSAIWSTNGTTLISSPVSVAGSCRASLAETTFISALASSMDRPGFSLPIPLNASAMRYFWNAGQRGSEVINIHSSACLFGY